MFKVILVLIFASTGLAVVVAIPGEQPFLAFFLGFVLTWAGLLIGDELDGRWRLRRK